MAGYYTVKQGDHMSGIAQAFGFLWQTIWNDPSNADLKRQRPNPHILFPGDQVFIPDKETEAFDRPTDNRHTFILKLPSLNLCIRLDRAYYKPIAGASCNLHVQLDSTDQQSDDSGSLERKILADEQQATLIVNETADVQGSERKIVTTIPVNIGYLDPIDTLPGQVKRLSNLGYYRGPLESPDPNAFQSALEEFQCDNHLTVDGIFGPKTRSMLEQVHGC
jgi:N-acetylmuramoyl-L-alanine amidase